MTTISTCSACKGGILSGESVPTCQQHVKHKLLIPGCLDSCHPHYLSPRAHAKLARPTALDGLRIHTDELQEVITRMAPSSLDHVVVRWDSLTLFSCIIHTTIPTNVPHIDHGQHGLVSPHAPTSQPRALNRVLKPNGKVLLRSAAQLPWYISHFEEAGFAVKCVARRDAGKCVDRVNMYKSTWVLRKVRDLLVVEGGQGEGKEKMVGMGTGVLSPLDLGVAAAAD